MIAAPSATPSSRCTVPVRASATIRSALARREMRTAREIDRELESVRLLFLQAEQRGMLVAAGEHYARLDELLEERMHLRLQPTERT